MRMIRMVRCKHYNHCSNKDNYSCMDGERKPVCDNITVNECGICFLNDHDNDIFVYLVFRKQYTGMICHDCNIMLSNNENKVVIAEEKVIELEDCF